MFNNLCSIDVGCNNIKMMAIVDGKTTCKTIPSGDNLTRKELVEIIHNFYLSFNDDFKGLGIAFSGFTSDYTKVDFSSLQCLDGLKAEDFSDLNCNVIRFINDSNASTLAGTIEFPNSKVLIGITNGTGIGCGVAINGKLFTGSNGFLGEIYGNPILDENGNIVKVGKICSGSKILKQLNQTNSKEEKEIIIHQSSVYFGMLLSQIIHLYNPDVIYFSGGGFDYPLFLDELIQITKKYCYPHFINNLVLKKSSYENYAGCVGAMKFLLSNEKIG